MNGIIPTFSPAPQMIERRDAMTNQLEDGSLRAFVKAAAEATQTHPDFVLVNVLAVLSTALNGKLEVRFRSQTEPVQLYLMAIAEPGERKSAVVRLTRGPIDTVGRQACLEEESPPSTYVDNITPNALAEAMSRAGGRVAVHSAEGGSLLQIMGNRQYPLAMFCNAYDAEDVHLCRAGKKPIAIPSAAMSICVAVQPHFAVKFARTQTVQEQGLLARFLMASFSSLAGARSPTAEHIPQSLTDDYGDIVFRLWNIPALNGGNRYPLELEYRAQQLYMQFASEAERHQGCGGQLTFDRAWGSKFCGKVLRIAAILHCAGRDEPLEHAIDATTLQQAIGICRQFRLNAQAFYEWTNDNVAESAHTILNLAWDWALRRRPWPSSSAHGEFSIEDLLNTDITLGRRQAKAAVERLLRAGKIGEDLSHYNSQCMNRGWGRKRSPRYVVLFAPPCAPLVNYSGAWR